MKHKMRLNGAPFEGVKSGRKRIEMRLFDEKRACICEGDNIEFENTETGERLLCKVKRIFRYANFEELYQRHDKLSIGYKEEEIADPKDMLAYYPQEKIDRYGVVGIEVGEIE